MDFEGEHLNQIFLHSEIQTWVIELSDPIFTRRFRRTWTANEIQRRVQAIHQATTRIQILVFNCQIDRHRDVSHFVRLFQHTSILAYPRCLLYYTVLHNDEETDKGIISKCLELWGWLVSDNFSNAFHIFLALRKVSVKVSVHLRILNRLFK